MPIPFLMAAGAAVSGVNAIIANNKSNSAKIDSQNYENRIIDLENNRQEIINPYAGVSDLSSMLKNPYADMNNPYANLRVSTKAAEMQAEQSDIALANTLDTLRATGSSAGGATALAQAALKSKQGISADIEKQESANEKLRAKGQFELEALKAAEPENEYLSKPELEKKIREKRKIMEEAAKALDFIIAAKLRDEIKGYQNKLEKLKV